MWRKGSVGVSRDCPNFSGTPYYPRNGESYGFQIWPVHSEGPSLHPNKSPWKILEKRKRGRIQGSAHFGVTPYYLRNGKSYRFQSWPVHSEGSSEQKSIKNLVEKCAWAYPGTAQFPVPLIISGTRKATDFKFGQYIQRVHPNKSPWKKSEKRERGVSRDFAKFSGTP